MSAARLLSRRRLLGSALAATAVAGSGALLVSCADDTAPTAGEDTGITPDDRPWTFTDGIGQEISLRQRPTRIAAYGDAAAALINFGVTPVAIFHFVPPDQDPLFDDVDLGDIPVVGTAYGEIETERLLAEIVPDLVVTTSYDGETPDTMYGFKNKSQLDQIREVAPVLGILQAGSALDVIGRQEELLRSLGVDVDGGPVARDRADFEAAGEELRAVAEGGPSVVAVYADDSGLYYAKAPDDPSLSYYASLGVRFPDIAGEEYYWKTVSWENADAYPTDLVLYSMRTSYTPEQLLAEPVFAATPAARADQLHPWVFASMDYRSQAAYLRQLAGWLADARVVT